MAHRAHEDSSTNIQTIDYWLEMIIFMGEPRGHPRHVRKQLVLLFPSAISLFLSASRWLETVRFIIISEVDNAMPKKSSLESTETQGTV